MFTWNPPEPADYMNQIDILCNTDPFDADDNAISRAAIGIAPRDLVEVWEAENHNEDEIPF